MLHEFGPSRAYELQHILIASGVWIPPERGSPDGPNQCCCGAAVVRARMPA